MMKSNHRVGDVKKHDRAVSNKVVNEFLRMTAVLAGTADSVY